MARIVDYLNLKESEAKEYRQSFLEDGGVQKCAGDGCNVTLQETITGYRHATDVCTGDKLCLCSDCYYRRLGTFLKDNPILKTT